MELLNHLPSNSMVFTNSAWHEDDEQKKSQTHILKHTFSTWTISAMLSHGQCASIILILSGVLLPKTSILLERCCDGGHWKFRPYGVGAVTSHIASTILPPLKCNRHGWDPTCDSVRNFATVIAPFNALLQGNNKLSTWSEVCDDAFTRLRRLLTSPLIWCHFAPSART